MLKLIGIVLKLFGGADVPKISHLHLFSCSFQLEVCNNAAIFIEAIYNLYS
jgi:hypothetical protein